MFFIPSLNFYFSGNIGDPSLHMLDVIRWAQGSWQVAVASATASARFTHQRSRASSRGGAPHRPPPAPPCPAVTSAASTPTGTPREALITFTLR